MYFVFFLLGVGNIIMLKCFGFDILLINKCFLLWSVGFIDFLLIVIGEIKK